jgi:serine/threonine protein phosphatase PrpC
VRLTTDHNVGQLFGVKGPMAAHLCRAVGIEPTVEVDLLVDLPEPGDLYVLCSDGLTKMVKERRLPQYLVVDTDLPTLVDSLVDAANAKGGVDNITVVLVRIEAP